MRFRYNRQFSDQVEGVAQDLGIDILSQPFSLTTQPHATHLGKHSGPPAGLLFDLHHEKVAPRRKTRVETMIVSDVHLGSEVSRARDLLGVLQAHTFRRLILLGDIFSDLNFKRLKCEHWELLSHIRKLSNPRRNVEVVWVEGNHDSGLSEVMSHLVGVEVLQEYDWDYGGKKYLAIHGHQFDRLLVDNQLLSHMISQSYLWIQKRDFRRQRFSRYLDKLNTCWSRVTPRVAAGALRLAAARKANYVFCGHTHVALEHEANGIHYFNTGCWTQSPATYITIDDLGVRLHHHE